MDVLQTSAFLTSATQMLHVVFETSEIPSSKPQNITWFYPQPTLQAPSWHAFFCASSRTKLRRLFFFSWKWAFISYLAPGHNLDGPSGQITKTSRHKIILYSGCFATFSTFSQIFLHFIFTSQDKMPIVFGVFGGFFFSFLLFYSLCWSNSLSIL